VFFGSRLQVNHLQHHIGSQSFKAQVAVGSWYGTPLLPDSKVPTSIIKNRMLKSFGAGSGPAVDIMDTEPQAIVVDLNTRLYARYMVFCLIAIYGSSR